MQGAVGDSNMSVLGASLFRESGEETSAVFLTQPGLEGLLGPSGQLPLSCPHLPRGRFSHSTGENHLLWKGPPTFMFRIFFEARSITDLYELLSDMPGPRLSILTSINSCNYLNNPTR